MDKQSDDELFLPHGALLAYLSRLRAFDTARVVIIPVPYTAPPNIRAEPREGHRPLSTLTVLELYDAELDSELSEVAFTPA